MKIAMIVLGGAPDRSCEALGWSTPLQAASLPNLDALTALGACGQMYIFTPGICRPAGESLWELLGFGELGFPGEAAIDLAAAGVRLKKGEVAFTVTLASSRLDTQERYLQASPAFLPNAHAVDIADVLSEYRAQEYGFRLMPTGGPFMAVILSGGAGKTIRGSVPSSFMDPIPQVLPLVSEGEVEKTAAELNRFVDWARNSLSDHPVNIERENQGKPAVNELLISSPSTALTTPTFEELWGLRAFVSGNGNAPAGIASLLGMEFAESGSGDHGESLYNSIMSARKALNEGYGFALIYSDAAESTSGSGRPTKKVRLLEELDLAMLAVNEQFARDDDLITIVTSDHTSPSNAIPGSTGSGESVPVIMVGRNARRDAVDAFDELSCTSGSLGTIRGSDLLRLAAGT